MPHWAPTHPQPPSPRKNKDRFIRSASSGLHGARSPELLGKTREGRLLQLYPAVSVVHLIRQLHRAAGKWLVQLRDGIPCQCLSAHLESSSHWDRSDPLPADSAGGCRNVHTTKVVTSAHASVCLGPGPDTYVTTFEESLYFLFPQLSGNL